MEIFESNTFFSLKNNLQNAKNIAIIGHSNPDGDCLGATLALRRFFELSNYKVNLIIPTEVPEFLKWLNGLETVLVYKNDAEKIHQILYSADIIFLIDFNDLGRINSLGEFVATLKTTKVVIDHHREPANFTEFLFVDILSSSASELVYLFIKAINESLIDTTIAEYIFLGLSSDTGNFMYNNANSQTFAIASELLQFNIDKGRIIKGLYNNFSVNRMQLVGDLMVNNLVYLPQKNSAYISIDQNIQKKYNYKTGDQEGIVNIPLSISDVNFSVSFFENKDEIRISLRSTGDFDVNKIARNYFQGGGHKNAAGGKSILPLQETLKFFEDNLDEMIILAKN